MRLLNTRTLEFRWFPNPHAVDYAILSHVWSKDGEQSHVEVLEVIREERTSQGSGAESRLSEKIRRFCERALEDGYEWVWADSCCIDKSSSSEVSEAINSMYAWYRNAAQCYVFLYDVDDDDDPRQRSSQFRRSEWFTRGWTLQELIAPAVLIFLSNTWTTIGTKDSLAKVVEQITKVEAGVLKGYVSLTTLPVAVRMSWAANRDTTREEDKAYSLLGIFGIHMIPMYGEGHHAFFRLQNAILQKVADDTLLGWGRPLHLAQPADFSLLTARDVTSSHELGLFAPTPQLFRSTGDLLPIPQRLLMTCLGLSHEDEFPTIHTNTRHGVLVHLPVLVISRRDPEHHITLGFLPCLDTKKRFVALILRPGTTPGCLVVGCYTSQVPGGERYFRTVRVDYAALKCWMRYSGTAATVQSVFVLAHDPLYHSDPRADIGKHPSPHRGKCSVLFPSWRKAALAKQGIAVHQSAFDDPSVGPEWCSRRHIVVLSREGMGAVRFILGFCEHCKPSEIEEHPDFKLWKGFRLQIQSRANPYDPTSVERDANEASCRFTPHPSGHTDDFTHIHHWPCRDNTYMMEWTLADQVMRLCLTFPASRQGLALTMDVDFRESGFPTTPTNSLQDVIDDDSPIQQSNTDPPDSPSACSTLSIGLRHLFSAEVDPWPDATSEDDSCAPAPHERGFSPASDNYVCDSWSGRRADQEEAVRQTAAQWHWHGQA